MPDTDDLIERLSRDRRPRPRLWPAYPLAPMALTLALALLVPHLLMGDACHSFAPSLMGLPDWVPGAVIALLGASLALRLASPTEGGMGEIVVVLTGTGVTLAIWPWGADAMTWEAFRAALALNAAVGAPGLVLSLTLLRRGASLHRFPSGLGAGLAMGGVGMATLVLLCDGLAMPDRLAAAWVATWSLGLVGGLAGLRLLRW